MLTRLGAAVLAVAAASPATMRFDVQGHRGARGLAPENTLAAFAAALAAGVTTLEMDLGMTKDGTLVVSHDPRLNPDLTRDPQGRWLGEPGPPLISLDLSELRRYDVGRVRPESAYARRFPDQKAADGERIPTLAEVFAFVRRAGDDGVRFNIETKLDPRAPHLAPEPERFADALVDLLRAEGLTERATVQSFDWRTLRRVRARAPEIRTVCLTAQRPDDDNVRAGRPGAPPTLAGLDVDDFGGSVPRLVKAAGCATWSPHAADLTTESLAQAHGGGLLVVPWTVNDPAQMERLVQAGVDGLITDRPDLLRKVLAARGR